MHLPDGIPSKLVHAAIKYVNKKIGEMKYFGAYGGKNNFQRDVSPSNDPEILNLFNKSFLKHLFELILGPRESKYEMVVGQMMPRFPGDFCYKEMHWHIDYVDVYNAEQQPSLPAVPNFDALVGVLLSDLHVEKSGELCTYPSSHRSLSKYFTKHTKEFEKLHQSGGSNVYSIMKDEEVFESDVYHCLGKAGDVFILNYMNAHYVTCNNSPNIRNNIYFRVWGNTFADHCREVYHFELENFGKDGCSNRTSMLNPLVHWRL